MMFTELQTLLAAKQVEINQLNEQIQEFMQGEEFQAVDPFVIEPAMQINIAKLSANLVQTYGYLRNVSGVDDE